MLIKTAQDRFIDLLLIQNVAEVDSITNKNRPIAAKKLIILFFWPVKNILYII